MIILRSDQISLLESVRAKLREGYRRILLQAPTGFGKTVVTAFMMQNATSKGKRSWFTVHRQELVRQSVDTLENAAGLNVGVIAAGWGMNGYHPAQVCSVQTLARRYEKFQAPDLLIVDECHHAVSASWSALIAALSVRNPAMLIIGLTATPSRLDGRGLAQHFDCMVQGPSTADLIEAGYLSKYRLWSAKMPDLQGVHTVAGDYNKQELSAAMSRTAVVGDALAEYQRHCMGKRAIAFMWSIQSSVDLAQRFNDAGITAAHVDGETKDHERARIVREFRDGRIKVLSSVELFGEGLDIPAAEAGFLMRPTQSLGLYLQQVGRLLRTAEGKDAALIFDHAGHVARHGYPDDARQWTLEGLEQGKAKKKAAPVRQCPKCYATLPVYVKVCKWCGHCFEIKPRKIEREDGELVEVSGARIFSDPTQRYQERLEVREAKTLEELQAIGRARGYKPKWAWVQWNLRKGNRGVRVAHGKRGVMDGTSHGSVGKLYGLAAGFRPKK